MPAARQRTRMRAVRRAAARQKLREPSGLFPRASAAAVGWWRRAGLWWRVGTVSGAALVCALVVWLIVAPAGKPTVDNGKYLAFTACLLTDSRGLAAEPASSAWAGMQQAAAATKMQTEYLEVPASASTADPYLASLVVRHCGVIVAAGPAAAAAVQSDAARFTAVRFVVAGATAHGSNVAAVPSAQGSSLSSQVARQVIAALSKSI